MLCNSHYVYNARSMNAMRSDCINLGEMPLLPEWKLRRNGGRDGDLGDEPLSHTSRWRCLGLVLEEEKTVCDSTREFLCADPGLTGYSRFLASARNAKVWQLVGEMLHLVQVCSKKYEGLRSSTIPVYGARMAEVGPFFLVGELWWRFG